MLRLPSWVLFILICASLAGCAGQPAQPPQIQADSASAGVSVSIEAQTEAVVIAIEDPAGIGSAQFSHTGGEFPQRLVYQFHLKGLEQVQLAYGEKQVMASLSSRPGSPVLQSLVPGGEALQEGSPYWLGIEIVPQEGAEAAIPLQSGYIQVEPPPDFYQTRPEGWSLSWVDFYR